MHCIEQATFGLSRLTRIATGPVVQRERRGFVQLLVRFLLLCWPCLPHLAHRVSSHAFVVGPDYKVPEAGEIGNQVVHSIAAQYRTRARNAAHSESQLRYT